MWYLIFLFLTIISLLNIIYPFLIKLDIRLNVLRLKGILVIKLFNKIKFEFKFRIKNGYVYLYYKNKEIKQKISNKNISLRFIFILIKQTYFRQQLLNSKITSNFGYLNDSRITALTSGYIDCVAKGFFAKIKNNKKSAHIFIDVEPKYNEDICNIRFEWEVRMSIFDMLYTFIFTIYYFCRDYFYRKLKKKI